MSGWHEPLEYYFSTRWFDQGRGSLPSKLYAALAETIGSGTEVDLVYPLEEEDDAIAFLIVTGDAAVKVRFEPPSVTTVFFLHDGRFLRRDCRLTRPGRP